MNKSVAMVCLALVLVFTGAGVRVNADEGNIVINEVCGANRKAIKDQDGESPDWIELYNPTDHAIDLKGYRLSDDADEPNTFVFGKTRIEPYGYALVFASKKLHISPELHADFRLSSEGGETVCLFAPDGTLINTATLPSLEKDVAYGRRFDGGDAWGRITPTPNQTNNIAALAEPDPYVAPPMFSHESGFYDDEILLTLSVPEGTSVYYTTDGSKPSENSTRYDAPLALSDASERDNVYSVMKNLTTRSYFTPSEPVDKCNVVRAVAVDEEGNQSDIVTKSFFIGFDGKECCENVYVVSLVSDPNNFFDYDTGIYTTGVVFDDWRQGDEYDETINEFWQPANYNQRGREWEREAEITFFSSDRQYLFAQSVGMRVHGRITRSSAQKSFNIYARDEYGSDTLTLPLFDGVRETSSLVLRTGGNDAALSKLRDAFAQRLAQGRAIDTQSAIPCAVFLDGEYWGMYFIEQRYDDDYLEAQYGIDKKNVILAEYGKLEEGEPGEYSLYTDLVSFAQKNDLSLQKNYQALSGMMDIDSLIDYFCAEIYLGNSDWPWNNYTLWRSRETSERAFEDGRWRYMLNDMDQTMGYDKELSGYERNTIELAKENEIFSALLANEEFVRKFTQTFMDLCNTNFSSERAILLLDEMAAMLTNATVADYKRVRSAGRGASYYERCVDDIRKFLENREEYITGYLREEFSLSAQPAELTLCVTDAAMGGIALNSIAPDLSLGEWTGKYFVDYPVVVTATPKDGYRFSHWVVENGNAMGDVQKDSLFVRISTLGTKVSAIFEKADDTQARQTLAAFSYHDPSVALIGSSLNGYAATGGLFAQTARLNASVDSVRARKLEWSDIAYDGGGLSPVMRANNKNRWSTDAYFDFSLSTYGYHRLRLNASLGADWQGARCFSLSYSTDGRNYFAIENSSVVLSKPEMISAVYRDFELPEALKNHAALHLRIRVSGDQTVRGRAKLTGLTEGEVAINDLSVTGEAIPIDPSAYQNTVAAIGALTGVPDTDRAALNAEINAFLTENQSQAALDAQTHRLRIMAEALPFSPSGFEAIQEALPEAARQNAVSVRVCGGMYSFVYPIHVDLSAFGEEAYVYRLTDDTLTLQNVLPLHDDNKARAPLPKWEAGAYLLLDRRLSSYCTACTLTPMRMEGIWQDGELADHLLTASAWLDIDAAGIGFDGHIEENIAEYGFRGSVWGYAVQDVVIGEEAFRASVRDGVLTIDGLNEGRYLLLSHDIVGIQNNLARAERMKASRESAPKASMLPWIIGGVVVALCAAAIAWRIYTVRKKKREQSK